MASPIVKRKIICPICEKESYQYSIMPNQYIIEEKESDQHPIKIKWYNPDFQDIKPHYYVLFHCPYCMFTDFEDNFTKPLTITNFQSLRSNYIKPNPTKTKVLQFFNSKISYEKMNFTSALFAHLNAIYIYELEEREQYKDVKKLARLYLRTAWLFREEESNKIISNDDELLKELQNNIDNLNSGLNDLNRRLNPLVDNIKRRVIELGIKYDDPNNPYLSQVNEFNNLSEQLQKIISKIRLLTKKDKELIQKTTQNQTEENYLDDIAKLSDCWPTIPMNERDCLNKAIEYYERQYQKVNSNDSLNQQIGIMNILTELCLRVNNYKKAFEYLSSLYQFCALNRQNLYSQQRQNPSSLIESQINKLGDIMFDLSEKRKIIEEKQYEHYYPQIKKYVEENTEKTWLEIREELINRNYPELDLDKYFQEESSEEEVEETKNEPQKKKKRWGIF